MKLDSDNPLALEIQQEKAAAYFAACRKMVDALEALRVFDRAAALASGPERLAHRCKLIEAAAERVYFVLIQREAMKFSHDPAFFEHYEVPREVQTRLGARQSQ
jgi:hypothetical protein